MRLRKRISRAGSPIGRPAAVRQGACRCHGRLQPQHGRGRRRGAVERPRQAAEGDHAGAHRGAREGHQPAERELAVSRGGAQRPEHDDVGGDHQEQAAGQGPLAQPRRLVLEVGQEQAARLEPLDGPAGQSEQSQLLGGGRVDGEAVSVVGVALGLAHLLGIAVAPDAALAQQPVGAEPRAHEQDRRPPGIAGEHGGRREPTHHLDQPAGDEVHRNEDRRAGDAEIEITGHRQVARELGVFKMAHARRPDAGGGELVVKPARCPAAEQGAHGLVDRRRDLQEHEDRARPPPAAPTGHPSARSCR